MHDDSELKKLLLETHSLSPGQEDRAWLALKERLAPTSRWAWLYYPTWGGAVASIIAVGAIAAWVQTYSPGSFVSADSQSPGIYATTFYSNSAHAQVVWLNGMEPASDQPTYMDPTSVVTAPTATDTPATKTSDGDPNSL